MIINVKEICGETLCSMKKGTKLYNLLLEIFSNKSDEKIILDFSDIKLFSSHFFNASISYLIKDYTIKEIKNKVEIIGLPEYAREILNISISNAIAHYNKKEK